MATLPSESPGFLMVLEALELLRLLLVPLASEPLPLLLVRSAAGEHPEASVEYPELDHVDLASANNHPSWSDIVNLRTPHKIQS
ncbi:hypothetical protein MTO96_027740 [Rhipicephalus appendiculatus]